MAGEAVELRCRVSDCETIRIAAGSVRAVGDVFAQGDVLAFTVDRFGAGDEVVGIVRAPHVRGPKASVAVVAGDTAYFVAGSPGYFTNVVTGRRCGYFKVGAALSATTAELAFDGYGS